MSRPVLYGFPLSSATARVRTTLELKGVDYEFRLVDLRAGAHREPNYLRDVNPQGQVPALVIDGHTLSQSISICEYLDETRPEPRLMPEQPRERARCRQLVELINSGIQPLQNLGVIRHLVEVTGAEPQRKEWPQYWIRRGFAALESLLGDSAGKYCVGDMVTLADVVLAPQVRGARIYGVEMTEFPGIARIDAALNQIEAFRAGLSTTA